MKGGIKMSMEDTFNGAMNAHTGYFAYFNAVAQEIGIKRAIVLLAKVNEELGTTQGKMMKEQSDIEEFDAQTALSLMKTLPENIGVSAEVIEASPQKVVFRSGRCPAYQAAQMMGLSAETIEATCRNGGEKLLEILAKQLNPNLSYQLTKFRSSADDFCESKLELI
jgi:hypothetical protein